MKYNVSMQCTVFAVISVEAKNKAEAEKLARKEKPANWDVQQYTLRPETVESIQEEEA